MSRKRGGTRAALALTELSVRANDIAENDLSQFLKDVFSIADDLDVSADRDRGFMAIAANDMRIQWLLNSLLRDRLTLPVRSKLIREAAPEASLNCLIRLSDRCKPKREDSTPQDDREKLTDAETGEWLYDLSLDRLRASAADGSLAGKSGLPALLFRWRDRAGAEEVRTWTDVQISNADFVVLLAKDLVQETWSYGMGGFGFLGDRVAQKADYANLKSLEPFLNVALLRQRIVALLESTEINAEQREALKRFQQTPERDPS